MTSKQTSINGNIALKTGEFQSSISTENSAVIEAINLLISAVETRRSEFDRSSYIKEPEFVSANDICTRLSIARATINKWQESRNFPLPKKIGNHCNRWRKSEVDAWVEENF